MGVIDFTVGNTESEWNRKFGIIDSKESFKTWKW